MFLNIISWLDIAIILILLKYIFISKNVGVVGEIFSFSVTFIALIYILRLFLPLAEVLRIYLFIPGVIARPVSFLILLVTIWLITRFVKSIIGFFHNNTVAESSGSKFYFIIFRLSRGVIASGLFVFWLALLPFYYIHSAVFEYSLTGRMFIRLVLFLYNKTVLLYNGSFIQEDIFF